MSQVHVNHIRKTLEKLYHGKIDLFDCKGYSEDKMESAFLSRSLAAYALSILAEIENKEAASCIVDGADDNGIDALYADKDNHTIYLVSQNGSILEKVVQKRETFIALRMVLRI